MPKSQRLSRSYVFGFETSSKTGRLIACNRTLNDWNSVSTISTKEAGRTQAMSDDKLGTCPSENYGHTLQFCRARHAISSPAWQPLPAQPAAPEPRCQFVRQCELEDGHNGWHKHGNDWWQPPAPNVTTAPLTKSDSTSVTHFDYFGDDEPQPKCQWCNGYHSGGCHKEPAKKATTAPEEAAARETQSAEPTVEDALRCIRKMEQCTGDTAKVLLIKNLFQRLSSAREAEIIRLEQRIEDLTGFTG